MANNLEREGRKYNQDELRLLEEMVGTHSFVYIGKQLKRSPKAVERQLTRMGLLHTKISGGWLSANEIAKALNTHFKVILRWKDQLGFPLKNKNLRYGKAKYVSWHISVDDFWRWASKHKEVVNWTRYEPESLLPEPAWLRDMIRIQRETIPKKQKLYWTPTEEKKAWDMYYRGIMQKDIAKSLDRSVNSVEKKLKRLRDMKLRGEKLPWEA